MKIQSILLAALALGLTACGSMGRKYDAQRAQGVRKIAVLSFEIHQQQPKDSLGFSRMNELKEGRRGDRPEFQKMATNVYSILLDTIEAKTKWKPVPLAQLNANKDYTKRVLDSTTGFHQVSMTTANTEILNVKTVMNQVAFRKMSFANKAKIAKDLGADAFAEYIQYQEIDQNFGFGNLTGQAPFAFTGRSNLIVYGLDREEPIWQIQNIDGPKSSNSKKLPESMDQMQKLAKVGEEAAATSIRALVEQYGVD